MDNIKTREERLSALRLRSSTPVLIVGGGINGISTFRELALQGIPAILVEKGDWCQAASGALSRMIHGGLRYLETGEFTLVKESVTERDRLLKNASHYVFPLRTTVPIDNLAGGLVNATRRFLRLSDKPTRRGALLIKTGLSLYDIYTRQYGSMPKHQVRNEAATRDRWPGFAPWVKYSASYYDAWISAPERLGFELIDDAEKACPEALALNYLQLVSAEGETIILQDALSGERFSLQPHVLVNAGGAWIDQLNQRITSSRDLPKLIGGTKGSHLILDHPELLHMLDGEMVYFENQEGRVCIMFPWFGKVLVGSTDIRVDDPDAVVCEEEEKDYILESLRFVFPHIEVADSTIVYTFCGVRPLPASEAKLNGQISRNHSLVVLPADANRAWSTLCLVGGKWTTFRQFGEEAADRVLRLLGEKRHVSSGDEPIGGGRNFPKPSGQTAWLAQLAQRYGVPLPRVMQLAKRYGSRALPLLALIQQHGEQMLQHHAAYSDVELRYLIEHEQVCQLEDLLVRRTSLAICGELSAPLVQEIAEIMAATLGWSDSERAQQLQRGCANLARLHGLTGLHPTVFQEETRHVSNQ
ncbi:MULTISPECIES: glycerol-3-phosphate dehydrogenase/oxidase [unclassified Enterobacter]|jgi:glycerol-3-phosphate dehydrogenase|uniref:glycerol-3-phosphate dehydrogenase/oxidase n=1 Tax=unclassified Enterobacter TaxID=2608935 RepID=UPI0015C70B12|nr:MULTISPECIES: glycerol-3-phosphate dehydrogenase/oxidase [unclassified Enterobacter]MBB3303529.1 glycerol-3-phosphate dehydrogenase [Enterobacter sp. Sphag1F]NYI13366.1 glycerol-3-phosphate dehydrogenase [Enterobacter sp. Sphag71]